MLSFLNEGLIEQSREVFRLIELVQHLSARLALPTGSWLMQLIESGREQLKVSRAKEQLRAGRQWIEPVEAD